MARIYRVDVQRLVYRPKTPRLRIAYSKGGGQVEEKGVKADRVSYGYIYHATSPGVGGVKGPQLRLGCVETLATGGTVDHRVHKCFSRTDCDIAAGCATVRCDLGIYGVHGGGLHEVSRERVVWAIFNVLRTAVNERHESVGQFLRGATGARVLPRICATTDDGYSKAFRRCVLRWRP